MQKITMTNIAISSKCPMWAAVCFENHNGIPVGGKTGTLHKVKVDGGYDDNRYMSVFAGLSPISSPRLATVVVIDEPRQGDYFGGLVAAPVFSEITGNALRLMQVTPDETDQNTSLVSLDKGNVSGEES